MTQDDELPIERRESSDENARSASGSDGHHREPELSAADNLVLEIDRYSNRILNELRSLNAYIEARL